MEDQRTIVLLAILSFGIYFAVGYGAAWVLRASPGWRILSGIALPVALYLACWWIDAHSDGPRGIIYIPARALWVLPAIFLIRGCARG